MCAQTHLYLCEINYSHLLGLNIYNVFAYFILKCFWNPKICSYICVSGRYNTLIL